MYQNVDLKEYLAQYNINWAKDLPVGVPPTDVMICNNEHVFRLIYKSGVMEEKDLRTLAEVRDVSQDILWQATGLSILDTEEHAVDLNKLPYMKNKFKGIAEIYLNPKDGVVKHTPSRRCDGHYTWWHTTSFNIVDANIIFHKL